MASQLVALSEVERLSPACIRILGGNPGKFTLQGTNTYIVGTGRERLLIDTAEGVPAWADALERTLAQESATLSAAVITHWHPDHVGGISQVRKLVPGATIYQSQLESGRLGAAPGQEVLDIVEGQAFYVEGATLRAVHTPGHTTDHMAFVLEEEGSLFAGDNVLGQGTAVFEDLAVYLQSLARMRALYSEKRGTAAATPNRLYPGHGPVVEDGPAKITEYIEHRQQREDQVVRLLRSPDKVAAASSTSSAAASSSADGKSPSSWTAMELVEVIYADVRRDLYPAAERGLVQILQKLEDEGRVVQDGRAWTWRERSPL
ncbi:uncharacterized protein SPSK_00568 [Sporothrix schenckii 1099-18]|uniref:Metallo-beta-lactamase domain-containing protein n=1 Tax=Sporothrix schenckii 1099-18 TaxID=1397361 RepID=A0A0F2LR72_SPOSC|nr:uncharacterized protein SPSK_00568 [Sporothrix schenckii 1099-18]KJR80033.1 hypothetical protein SPSK_00568 [Sporothrix schenckii 1099-18]